MNMLKFFFSIGVASAFCLTPLYAAGNLLVSNYTFASAPAGKGKIWVFSRGDSNEGFSYLTLGHSESGVRAISGEIFPFENASEYSAVHDGILSDMLAERRRTPFAEAGKLGVVIPMFEEDSLGSFRKPAGFFSMRYAKNSDVNAVPLASPAVTYKDTVPKAMDGAVSGFAYDSTAETLWIARGTNGILAYDISKGLGSVREREYFLNAQTGVLDSLPYGAAIKLSEYPAIFSVAMHPKTKRLWLATSKGLFEGNDNHSHFSPVAALKNARVTGVWIGGSPVQMIAETASQSKGTLKSSLWQQYGKKSFQEVAFRDTTGKAIADVYDRADYSVSGVAFIGAKAFVAVRATGGGTSGLLKIDSVGAIPWSHENQWLYGFDAGVIDRDAIILSVNSFEAESGSIGLALSTYGNGISVSLDSGATWTSVLNQAHVGKNLSSVRMVPSVIAAGGESLVAYNVSKDSKITIEIFSYDMRKIRTIVKSAMRPASASRSTDPAEDFWDGKDDMGRAVTMGIYYVRVKDNHGHVGWGKVMSVGGN